MSTFWLSTTTGVLAPIWVSGRARNTVLPSWPLCCWPARSCCASRSLWLTPSGSASAAAAACAAGFAARPSSPVAPSTMVPSGCTVTTLLCEIARTRGDEAPDLRGALRAVRRVSEPLRNCVPNESSSAATAGAWFFRSLVAEFAELCREGGRREEAQHEDAERHGDHGDEQPGAEPAGRPFHGSCGASGSSR